MKVRRILFIFCSIVLSVLSGCIETPDASQFHAPTISASAASPAQASVTIVCQLSKGAHPSKITFRLSKSQSMSDAIETTVLGGVGESYSASFSGLEEGTQYYFDAEASGGRSSCRSSVGSFKTADAFDVDKDTKQINYQQQYVEFEVVSSIGLSVQIEDGADWVKESDTKAATKYRKTFLVDYNSSVEERTATIVFKSDAGGETRTVRIFQAGGPITIPDKNFKAYLVENFDKDGDGEIVLDEAKAVKTIDVCTDDIATLEGIEYFTNLQHLSASGTREEIEENGISNGKLNSLDVSKNTALTYLYCLDNQLTNIDVSKNIAITSLSCANNQIANLDISKNIALNYLFCYNNQLTNLDVSKNIALTRLDCYNNQLTNLDVSKNTALYRLKCENNQLTNLDVSNNLALTTLSCYGNPNLLMVWLASGQNINNLWYDSSVTKLVHKDDKVNISDANFKRYLVQNFDNDGDGEISMAEAEFIESIDVCTDDIVTLEGIENFPKLRHLSACGSWTGVSNGKLRSLDVSKNTALIELACYDNPSLTTLDVSKNTALTDLRCISNQIKNLDVSKNILLIYLECGGNQLTSLDISKNTALAFLGCGGNQLTNLDVTKNTALEELNCNTNQLTSLDVSKNTSLTRLDCVYNQLTSLDVSKNAMLNYLSCEVNQLPSLDVSKNTALSGLKCASNQLTSLDVSKNTALTLLYCGGNQLTSLDVSSNVALTNMRCENNQLTSLDVSRNTVLTELNCSNNQLINLDVSKNTALTELQCQDNKLKSLDVSRNIALTNMRCENNQLTSLDVSRNTVLTELWCINNPNMTELWLAYGQTINGLYYNQEVTTIKYK